MRSPEDSVEAIIRRAHHLVACLVVVSVLEAAVLIACGLIFLRLAWGGHEGPQPVRELPVRRRCRIARCPGQGQSAGTPY